MRYWIMIALAMPSLISLTIAQESLGNQVFLVNYDVGYAADKASLSQDSTNFAAVIGDGNLHQADNCDIAEVYSDEIAQKDSNAAFILGFENVVAQNNAKYATNRYKALSDEPGVDDNSIEQTELNQILICGNDNSVLQSNNAVAFDPGRVKITQDNFGAIIGTFNNIQQFNLNLARHNGTRGLTQRSTNIAYVYGTRNLVVEENYANATIPLKSEATLDQANRNMAFVVSTLRPGENFTIPAGPVPVLPECEVTLPTLPEVTACEMIFPDCFFLDGDLMDNWINLP